MNQTQLTISTRNRAPRGLRGWACSVVGRALVRKLEDRSVHRWASQEDTPGKQEAPPKIAQVGLAHYCMPKSEEQAREFHSDSTIL